MWYSIVLYGSIGYSAFVLVAIFLGMFFYDPWRMSNDPNSSINHDKPLENPTNRDIFRDDNEPKGNQTLNFQKRASGSDKISTNDETGTEEREPPTNNKPDMELLNLEGDGDGPNRISDPTPNCPPLSEVEDV